MSKKIDIAAYFKRHGKLPDGYALIHTATRLYKGWEMDNEIWVYRNEAGHTIALATNHGSEYVMKMSELEEAIKEHHEALKSLRFARLLLLAPT